MTKTSFKLIEELPAVRQGVLLVDDDPAILASSSKFLISCGYRVDCAADGAEGWKNLNQSNYDLLITDNSMPKVSGVELISKIRAAKLDVPILMITSMPPQREFDRRPELQPTAILLKPYSPEELEATVSRLIKKITNCA